jgi:hypothetical protein
MYLLAIGFRRIAGHSGIDVACSRSRGNVMRASGDHGNAVLKRGLRSMLAIALTPALTAIAMPSHAAVIMVVNTGDSGPGSLRQAIIEANVTTVADDIRFAIPGSGPHVIEIASSLPTFTQPVTVDGYSQPGASPNTLAADAGGLNSVIAIEIAPPTPATTGRAINLSGPALVTLRGLAIHGFSDAGIVANNGNLRLEGCYLGTRADGSLPERAQREGILLVGGQAVIGGTDPAQRNLMSGNSNDAIGVISRVPALTIAGNLIGTTRAGDAALPNLRHGVNISGSGPGGGLRIGGTTPAHRNIISANRQNGISVFCGGATTVNCLGELRVQGNWMGTDVTGTQVLPNAQPNAPQSGVAINIYTQSTIDDALIGGREPGAANLFAHHATAVAFRANPNPEAFDARLSIVGNDMSRNLGLDINLAIGNAPGNQRNPNDIADADTGANRFQNYPEFLSTTPLPGHRQWLVEFQVPSTTANSAYPLSIDFHHAIGTHAGEWIDSVDYPAGAAGLARIITLDFADPVQNLRLVATATDAQGRTSELSFPSDDRLFADGFDIIP